MIQQYLTSFNRYVLVARSGSARLPVRSRWIVSAVWRGLVCWFDGAPGANRFKGLGSFPVRLRVIGREALAAPPGA
jgi:hypothetical protein